MARVFNLKDVLELINDRLSNQMLARKQLVRQSHQAVFHITPRFGKELDALGFK